MESWPRVVVVGAGSVGSFFGGRLAQAGAPVILSGRPERRSPHLEAVARDGLRISSDESGQPVRVEVTDSAEAVARAELVLFAVKTVATEEAARQIAPHLGPDTVVVSLQNGVDNVEHMLAAGVDAIPTVVFVAAAIEQPGVVTHRGRGDLIIGHPERTEDVKRVAGWFERAGVPCPISDDVERELWIKLSINSMANAISALGDTTYHRITGHEPSWQIALDIADEAAQVARAAGVELGQDELVRVGLEVMRSVGDATSSTQQDIARGRPTEIDALNGYITRRGAELGIATPVNRTLWALVKLREG